MEKEILREMIAQNKMTSSFSFNRVFADTASLRLNENSASIGFIYRHIGETMNLFGWFLGIPTDVQNTTMGYQDTGQGSDVETSSALIERGYAMLDQLVESTTDWLEPVDTPFFGKVSKARMFAHVLYHTSNHAGQISLTLAKGKKY